MAFASVLLDTHAIISISEVLTLIARIFSEIPSRGHQLLSSWIYIEFPISSRITMVWRCSEVSFGWVTFALEAVLFNLSVVWANKVRIASLEVPFSNVFTTSVCEPELVISWGVTMICYRMAKTDKFLNASTINRASKEVATKLWGPKIPLCSLNVLTIRIHPEFVLSWRISMMSWLEMISFGVS